LKYAKHRLLNVDDWFAKSGFSQIPALDGWQRSVCFKQCLLPALLCEKAQERQCILSSATGGAIVHPEPKRALPLDFEPITRHDGNTKNVCERNAGKRLLYERMLIEYLPLISNLL